jgi:hypothetical protein
MGDLFSPSMAESLGNCAVGRDGQAKIVSSGNSDNIR